MLVAKDQLTDLTALLDAPSVDDPDKKVRDTLRPGVVEMGQFGGKPIWILYYAYTVYGVWYSKGDLEKLDAEYPETWDDMLALCAKAKKKGMAGWTYPGKYPYYLPFSLYPFIAKIGGRRGPRKIDNLEPNAWKDPAVKAAFEAYYELYKKGYVLKGTPGPGPHPVAERLGRGQGAVHPQRLLGGERVGQADHEEPALRSRGRRTVQPVGSDKMPFGTIWASGGEPYIVPAQGQERRGRHGAAAHHAQQGVLEELHPAGLLAHLAQRRHRGPEAAAGPGIGAGGLEKAGENIVNPRIQDWYVALQKERIGVGALGEMMAGRMTPAEAIKKIQKFADDSRDDSSQEVQALTEKFVGAPPGVGRERVTGGGTRREIGVGSHEAR